MKKYRIYGRLLAQKRFMAMDINDGYQTRNLAKATLLTEEEKDTFMKTEAPRNPDWVFEPRSIN